MGMICDNCKKKKKCKPYFLRGHYERFCSRDCLREFLINHPGMELYGTEVLQFNMEM